MPLLLIIILWLVIEFLFWCTHKKPLQEKHIRKLMLKRRKKYIRKHFTISKENILPEKSFKSSLKPSGMLYGIDMYSSHFPKYAANLLKGKKHEWVVLACLKDNKVKCFFANKGNNNQSVSFNVDIPWLIEFCKNNNYQTIMRLHNHPNSDPQKYNCLFPSEQDRKSAIYLTNIMSKEDINWIDYVCERGRVVEYSRYFSNSFYPEESSYTYIHNQNLNSKNYYRLHRELGLFH